MAYKNIEDKRAFSRQWNRKMSLNPVWREATNRAARKSWRVLRDRLKAEAYNILGDKCACCSESEVVFLTIDHVYNDGAVDRARYKRGEAIYRLVVNTHGSGRYQLLCRNCNWAKSNGGCPHKRLV